MAWLLTEPPTKGSLKGRKFEKAFGQRLASIRLERGIGIYDLCSELGMSATKTRMFETGYGIPNLRLLIRWASALGVQPGDILPTIPAEID